MTIDDFWVIFRQFENDLRDGKYTYLEVNGEIIDLHRIEDTPKFSQLVTSKGVKFLLNEITGLIKKYKINLEKFNELVDIRLVRLLVHMMAYGALSTGQAKEVVNSVLKRRLG